MENPATGKHKALSALLTVAVFAGLIVGTYAAFSGKLGGATINRWQAEHLTQGGKFFPILTIFVYVVPVGLIGVSLKFFLRKKSR